jgi:hypothetical protein
VQFNHASQHNRTVWLFGTDASLDPRLPVVVDASRGLGWSAEKRFTACFLSGAFSIANTINCELISNNQGKFGCALIVSLLRE